MSDSLAPRAVAHQAFLSMGFPRQEYWGGQPFPSPRDLSDPGVESAYPALQAVSCITGRHFTDHAIWAVMNSGSTSTNWRIKPMRPPPWSPRPPPPPRRAARCASLCLRLLPLDSLAPSTLLPPPRQAEAPQSLPRTPHGEAGSTAWGADAGGRPTCRGGAEHSWAPGPCKEGRKAEISLHSCENCKCGAQLCKPSAYRTWTDSGPCSPDGPSLSSCKLCERKQRGWGQIRVGAAPRHTQHIQVVTAAGLPSLRGLRRGEKGIGEMPEWTAGRPTVKAGPG